MRERTWRRVQVKPNQPRGGERGGGGGEEEEQGKEEGRRRVTVRGSPSQADNNRVMSVFGHDVISCQQTRGS